MPQLGRSPSRTDAKRFWLDLPTPRENDVNRGGGRAGTGGGGGGGRPRPPMADRALRALTLIERAESDPSAGSRELAELHLKRVLSRVSESRLRLFAEGHGKRLQGVALGASAIGFLAV